jgi:hypothetical protein
MARAPGRPRRWRRCRGGWVVADEAQAVKNPFSRTARALAASGSSARIALTGTPVENRLSDLWALLDWTTPGLLGRSTRSSARGGAHRAGAGRGRHTRLRQPSDPSSCAAASPIPTSPRPPAEDRDGPLRRASPRAVDPCTGPWWPSCLDDVAAAEGIDGRGLVLKLLTALKQSANHPAQYLGQDGPLPAGRELEAVSDCSRSHDEGDSVSCSPQYVAMGRLLTTHLDHSASSLRSCTGPRRWGGGRRWSTPTRPATPRSSSVPQGGGHRA